MGTTVRTAVIGLGYFGRFHAKHHAASDRAELVAVCDVDGDRAQAVSGEFGGAPVTDHMTLPGKVDAVSIAVPTSRHFEVARPFIEAGAHVLVEKPIAHDLESADRLIDLAERHNVILQVGHIERFSAAYRALAERTARPAFIEARRMSPWKPRATDVGVVLDLMIHDIDIVLGLVDSPIRSVESVGAAVLSASEDIADARITFANGCVADISASRVADKTERRVRVYQSDGYLVCDLGDHRLTRFEHGGRGATAADAIDMHTSDIPREDSLGNQIAAFLDCVGTGRRPTVDGRAGRRALEVAMRIAEGVREHRARLEADLAG